MSARTWKPCASCLDDRCLESGCEWPDSDCIKQPSGIGGRCAFGTMEWYCALPAGHGGSHQSDPIPAQASRVGIDQEDSNQP